MYVFCIVLFLVMYYSYLQIPPLSLLENRTIMSAVSIASLKFCLSFCASSIISCFVYFLFILFSVSVHPLWSDKWKCGHILFSFFSLFMNSSVNSLGSSEPYSYSFYSDLSHLFFLTGLLVLYFCLGLFHMLRFVFLLKLLLLFPAQLFVLFRL